MPTRTRSLSFTGDAAADRLLATEPLALLIGMLLDQQVPLEWAFRGPATLKDRLGGRLDAVEIAAMPEADLEAVFRTRPAMHRYPGAMAKRTHTLCAFLVEHYAGDAAKVWKGVRRGDDLLARVRALPGFGEDKSRIFVALLAKRFGVRPEGWELAAGPFADHHPRSVADIDSPERLAEVREFKRARKAQGASRTD